MIEFIIALISILVLFAGLMQLVSLGNARTDAMLEARRRAGINSLAGAIGGTAPEYIKDWEKGPDETSYSADDELERGNMGMFTIGIANYAKPDDLRDRVGQNMLTSTAADPGMLMINYQEGRASRTVQLLPVIRGMVYDADSIEIECEVWMPESGGLY